ncbi:[Histone H3]-lysine-36 demethylase [Pneumocystis jirovecii RU7]|uniref:JmjC domain-containing histone demethylation protein 1 n=1 Tax=Pneumocystis jirovecii (strain RU7) TaxID=1408657 RepID=A0A0W4ZRY9_PNEJ7|nr:[Histone H3]-lysine-36 demethylase [Pneumocystis jirovecii RU7]KTW31146.1 hypothetical protein T551_01219 [Pneumocystis jirovecii RU7]
MKTFQERSLSKKWDHCEICTPETAPKDTEIFWIQCKPCRKWYHIKCIDGLYSVDMIEDYHCRSCEPIYGLSTYRPQLRKSSRPHSFVDYVSLDQGSLALANQHAYTAMIENKIFTENTFKKIKGIELTKEWAEEEGFNEPVLIPAGWDYEGLEMKIPKDLTVRKVLEMLGPHEKIEVIDVPLQKEVSGWSLGEWVEYYEKPAEERDRIRNVISLEISLSELAKHIVRPKFVRDLDFADCMWPKDLKEAGQFPKVQLYCLMSVKNSFTDFHIDFGGTSVFYHVIKGSKTFLFIPPTQTNLKKYENWCLSPNQSETFLGDQVKECIRVDLNEGDTMLIPSGWIHAVHTPSDSLVLGGNFLTYLHMEMQLLVADIERRTKVPEKFKYPFFEKLLWFSVFYYLSLPLENVENFEHYLHHKKFSNLKIESKNRNIHQKELVGCEVLAKYLFIRAQMAKGLAPVTANGEKLSTPTQKQLRAMKLELPYQYFSGDFVELAKAFGRWIYYKKGLSIEEHPKWCSFESLESYSSELNSIFIRKKENKVSKKKKNSFYQSKISLNTFNIKQKNGLKHKKTTQASKMVNFSLNSELKCSIKHQDIKNTIKMEDTPISVSILSNSQVENKDTTTQSDLSYNIFSDNTVDNATKQAIKAAMFGLRYIKTKKYPISKISSVMQT